MIKKLVTILAVVFFMAPKMTLAQEDTSYVEPGSLRISNTLSLEGVFQKLKPGWVTFDDNLNKLFSVQGNNERPWKTEWGQRLLSEIGARFSPDVYTRALIEVQGEYADRFWRPINHEHRLEQDNENVFIREFEGLIDKDFWYFKGFSGVGTASWEPKGDFFRLYPPANPGRDYLGSSGHFGIYPKNWRQDQFLNITGRSIPRGVEGGIEIGGMDGTAAYGDELSWGNRESFYGRWRVPIKSTKLTFVYKDEDVNFSVFDDDERNRAYSLNWFVPFEEGHELEAGVLYNPFRRGQQYEVARRTTPGQGLLGGDVNIVTKTSRKEDAYAGRARYKRNAVLFDRAVVWVLDLTRAEILAGNKEQVDFSIGSDLFGPVQGHFQYTYRRPVEDAIPFLFEGTPTNIGAVRASPRGPESPFTVDWSNREAVFLVTTFQFDPTPGSAMFIYDQNALALWNLNPEEESDTSFAVQHRMSDYRSTTDRQYYFDSNGDVVWEPAGNTGAFATDHPLHEFRFLGRTRKGKWNWILGVAGGQSPAVLGLAYSLDTTQEKPITEYISFEARVERYPVAFWGHYGSGVWGPEENIHPNFGFSYDRLWGVGGSFNITRNTTWDLSYLAARQDDSLFVAPDLGSFDEIRTVFSHRFGFLFQFQGPSQRGYQSR